MILADSRRRSNQPLRCRQRGEDGGGRHQRQGAPRQQPHRHNDQTHLLEDHKQSYVRVQHRSPSPFVGGFQLKYEPLRLIRYLLQSTGEGGVLHYQKQQPNPPMTLQ